MKSETGIAVPSDLSKVVKDIKFAILQTRAKAAHLANAEALKLYFFVGGYISKKTRNAKWGSGAIDALSNQLQVELPGLRGFSASSIKRMRQLYEVWSQTFEIRPLPMGEIDGNELVSIRPLPMGEITSDQIGAFLSVGFTNHALIVEKTKTADERWYYVLECAKSGYELGFRTFVLQGGEDAYFTEERICGIVGKLREEYPDCAITLSIGEWEKNSYQRFFEAGANRYLLRHETAADEHYGRLHPETLSLAHRKQCLYDLREIGYQVGTGFMVGSPFQTGETLAKDMLFLKELQPQMVGIGPFIPHADTPFANETPGTMELTLRCIAFIRLSLPKALIPATTALGTINPIGRERGIMSGANVVMPNLSPVSVRKKYELYDNKICTGEEAAECRGCLESRMKNIGYEIVSERGDAPE